MAEGSAGRRAFQCLLLLLLLRLAGAALGTRTEAALAVDVLRVVGGLPPHVVGLFEEPIGFQQTAGAYTVCPRRSKT